MTAVNHSDVKNLIIRLKEAWEAAPPALQASAPGIMVNATDIITTATLYFEQIEPLTTIVKHLSLGAQCDPLVASEAIRNASMPIIQNNSTEIHTAMTSASHTTSEAITSGINSALGSVANKVLVTGIVAGSLCAIIEGYRTLQFWNSIKEARNLVRVSKVEGWRDGIQKRLDGLPKYYTKLNKILAFMKKLNLSNTEFEGAKDLANQTISQLRVELEEIMLKIEQIKVKIGNAVVNLSNGRSTAIVLSISGAVSCATGVTNVVLLGAFANPILAITLGIVAGVTGIIAITYATLYVISKKDLENLNDELDEITMLKNTGLQFERDLRTKAGEINSLAIGRAVQAGFDIHQFD